MSVVSTEIKSTPHTKKASSVLGKELLIAACFALLFGAVAISMIGKWSLYDDEIFTYRQIVKPTFECLKFNVDKPVYYMLAHGMIQTSLPLEFAMRLPAAIAAALIAPVFYLLTARLLTHRSRLYLAILLSTNPWIFELSQMARFYSIVFLFGGAALLCLLNWLHDDCVAPAKRKKTWLVGYLVCGVIATLTHTTAAMVFVAATIGVVVFFASNDFAEFKRTLARHAKWLIPVSIALGLAAAVTLILRAEHWLSVTTGSRTPIGIAVRAALFSGLQVWALAFVPLVKRPKDWKPSELFMVSMIVISILPLLLLAYLGARIHIRYLLQALPFVFVLAAMHWEAVSRRIETFRFRVALGVAIVSMYVPYGISNLVDGNHLDYRKTVRFVEQLDISDPIIACSFKDAFDLYATEEHETHELDFLSVMNGGALGDRTVPGRTILELIERSKSSGRPLLIVSAETRGILDRDARKWMGDRFATLATVESPRYDHRRNQLIVYEYRPRI